MKAILLSSLLLALSSLSINAQEVTATQTDSAGNSEVRATAVKPPSLPVSEKRLKLSIRENYRLPRVSGQVNQLGQFGIITMPFVATDGRLANFGVLGMSKIAQNNFQLLSPGSLRWQSGMINNLAIGTQNILPFSLAITSTPKKQAGRQPFGGKKKEKKRKIWY
jgi:hypothetical protein